MYVNYIIDIYLNNWKYYFHKSTRKQKLNKYFFYQKHLFTKCFIVL